MFRPSGNEEKDLCVIRQYRGLVLELAWHYWRRLPAYTKLWVDPEDLIEEAYIYVLTRVGKRAWNPARGAQSTYLWCGISSILTNFALAQQTKKRFGHSVPLEALKYVGGADKRLVSWEAQDALNKIYDHASRGLQLQMRQWFGPGEPKCSRAGKSQGFYVEFKSLASRYKFTVDDCKKMMGRGVWTD